MISIDFIRRIIELGAGSGLLGLALLKYSNEIPSYTFTDYSPMILNLLRQNFLLNFPEDMKQINIEELDWNQYTKENAHHDCFDLILAAGKFEYGCVIHFDSAFRCRLRSIGHR